MRKWRSLEFPQSPEVRTLCFHCLGPGSSPGQETKILHSDMAGKKSQMENLKDRRAERLSEFCYVTHSTLRQSCISRTPGISITVSGTELGTVESKMNGVAAPDNLWAKGWRVSTLAYSMTLYNTYFPKPSSFTHLPFFSGP